MSDITISAHHMLSIALRSRKWQLFQSAGPQIYPERDTAFNLEPPCYGHRQLGDMNCLFCVQYVYYCITVIAGVLHHSIVFLSCALDALHATFDVILHCIWLRVLRS